MPTHVWPSVCPVQSESGVVVVVVAARSPSFSNQALRNSATSLGHCHGSTGVSQVGRVHRAVEQLRDTVIRCVQFSSVIGFCSCSLITKVMTAALM